jgi:hypothetical protein
MAQPENNIVALGAVGGERGAVLAAEVVTSPCHFDGRVLPQFRVRRYNVTLLAGRPRNERAYS